MSRISDMEARLYSEYSEYVRIVLINLGSEKILEVANRLNLQVRTELIKSSIMQTSVIELIRENMSIIAPGISYYDIESMIFGDYNKYHFESGVFKEFLNYFVAQDLLMTENVTRYSFDRPTTEIHIWPTCMRR